MERRRGEKGREREREGARALPQRAEPQAWPKLFNMKVNGEGGSNVGQGQIVIHANLEGKAYANVWKCIHKFTSFKSFSSLTSDLGRLNLEIR